MCTSLILNLLHVLPIYFIRFTSKGEYHFGTTAYHDDSLSHTQWMSLVLALYIYIYSLAWCSSIVLYISVYMLLLGVTTTCVYAQPCLVQFSCLAVQWCSFSLNSEALQFRYRVGQTRVNHSRHGRKAITHPIHRSDFPLFFPSCKQRVSKWVCANFATEETVRCICKIFKNKIRFKT